MKEAVIRFIEENKLLTKNKTVFVGVSGGADSLSLLHLLNELKDDWQLDLKAIIVNHQLREDAWKDTKWVNEFCKKRNIPLEEVVVSVNDYKEKEKVSTQLAARKLRYDAFKRCMQSYQNPILALGHHGDDQVETMILQMMRTADSASLLGIPVTRPFANGKIIRPLLTVTKDDIYHYCKCEKINFITDPSNTDPIYRRNEIRQTVLPLFKKHNAQIHETIQRLSQHLQNDESYLQEEAKKVLKNNFSFTKNPTIGRLKIASFKKCQFSLQRRAYHLILKYLYNGLLPDLNYTHEEIFFNLLKEKKNNLTLDFPNGLTVARFYDEIYLYFTEELANFSNFSKTLTIPGNVSLPDGSKLHASYTKTALPLTNDQFTYVAYESDLSYPLKVRTVTSDDRMVWQGLNGSKRVRRIFIDEKLPSFKREFWPLVVQNNNEVLWLVGLKKGEPKKSLKQGRKVYFQLTYKDDCLYDLS